MTEQYAQININNNGSAASFTSAVGDDAYSIRPGERLLSVDSGAAATTITLPPISSIGDEERITIYSAVAGSVTVQSDPADPAIVNGTSPNPILLEGGSLTLISSTTTGSWYVVGVTV